jgi:hypothetical protein
MVKRRQKVTQIRSIKSIAKYQTDKNQKPTLI